MGWSEAHTNPEQDLAGLRSELDGCRAEIDRLRGENDLLADALGWLLAEHQDLDVDAPERVVEACEWVRGAEPPGRPMVDVPVAGGRL